MTKYLLTGGCGFIGSHIADQLVLNGSTVVIIDDLSTGLKENLNSEVIFYEGSITNLEIVKKIFSEHNFDGVIHEASHINTSVPDEQPQRDIDINVKGTLNLIEQILKYNSGKFVYASSVAVYGSPVEIPVSEFGPIRPIYSYGIAKQCAEEYVRYFGANKGLNYHIARYGNIYGPRQPIYGEVGVIAIFTQKILREEPLTIYGSGEYLRDFLFIDDAVEATLRLLNLPGSDTFNLASGKPTSVNEVVGAFEVILDKSLNINSKPERANELGKFYANTSKLRKTLDWHPRTDLVQGLKLTLDFYQNPKR